MPATDLFIYQFPTKTTPVGADILYVGDSANSFSEVQSTITQLVTSNSIVTASSPLSAGVLASTGTSNKVASTGITVSSNNIGNVTSLALTQDPSTALQAATKQYADTKLAKSQNLGDLQSAAAGRSNLGLGTAAIKAASSNSEATLASVSGPITVGNVPVFADTAGTIENGGSLTGFMLRINNLGDVVSKEISFNTIAPTTTAGDLIYYSSSNTNTRLPIGPTGYILSSQGGAPQWTQPGVISGFVDNAIFSSNLGQVINDGAFVPVNLAVLKQQTAGNTWVVNGDNTGMKCGAAGTYIFTAYIPIINQSQDSGLLRAQFKQNSTQVGPIVAYNGPAITNNIDVISVTAIIACNANDVIRLTIASPVTLGIYSTVDPTIYSCDGQFVSIVRLL